MKALPFLFLCLLPTLHADEEKANSDSTESVIKTTEQHFEEGKAFFEKGEYAAAINSFSLSELEAEEFYPIYYNRGLAHLAIKEFEKAQEYFNKALSSQDQSLRLKANYNLGHCHYLQANVLPESKEGKEPVDQLEHVKQHFQDAVNSFREVEDLSKRHKAELSSADLDIVAKAKTNEEIIIAKYTYLSDEAAKSKGRKTKVIQGNVKVNGQPAQHAFVYLKSKWDSHIHGHVRTDETGKFIFEGLEIGKYELAAALYETTNATHLEWNENVAKVPSYETDQNDLEIRGAMTLAMPYQTAIPSLDTPWDDHLRFNGAQSITSSTDWGELTDGRPIDTLPEDNDFHQGYVAFDALNLRLGMGIPTPQQPQQPQAPGQQIQQSTEPTEPPTYKITLKGFQDLEDVHFPSHVTVMGLKQVQQEGQEEPQQQTVHLYSSNIQVDAKGVTEWKSEEFEHQDCRQLIFSFDREKGKRMSFHEIEVYEDTKQQNDDQNQDQNQDQDQQENQDQQEQNQDQQGDQGDQDQQQPPEQQEQPDQERESRSVRSILQKIKDKNEEAKEKQKGTGIILHSEKDY